MRVQEDLRIEDVRVVDDRPRPRGLQVFRMRDGRRVWPPSPDQEVSLEEIGILDALPIQGSANEGAAPHSTWDNILALLRFQDSILSVVGSNPPARPMGSRFAQGFLDGLSTLVPTAMEFASEYIRDRLNW